MAEIIKADAIARQTAENRLEEAALRAEQILEAVRGRAEAILEQARDEAERIREDARLQGQEAAREEARATLDSQLQQRLRTVLPALEETIRMVAEAGETWRRDRERTLIRLARKIAEHVLRRELREDPQVTLQWVREALQLVAGSQRVSIRLHPDDHAALRPYLEPLLEQLGPPGGTEVVADPQIQPAGCLVRTEFGEIDQQWKTQLDRIEDELSF